MGDERISAWLARTTRERERAAYDALHDPDLTWGERAVLCSKVANIDEIMGALRRIVLGGSGYTTGTDRPVA